MSSARMAEEALLLLDAGETIDLLFTDVVMPGERTGVDLAIEVQNRLPGLPVLFATGYTDRKVLDRWPGQIQLLAKPYSIHAVTSAIHSALPIPELEDGGPPINCVGAGGGVPQGRLSYWEDADQSAASAT